MGNGAFVSRWLWLVLTGFFMLVCLVPGVARANHIQFKPEGTSVSASRDGKVTITFALSKRPWPFIENLAVALFDKDGKQIGARRVSFTQTTGKFEVAGQPGDRFVLRLRERAGKKVHADRVLTVSGTVDPDDPPPGDDDPPPGDDDPTPEPTPPGDSDPDRDDDGNPDADDTNCFKFRGTFFSGDDGICASNYLQRFYLWAVGLAVLGAVGMIIYAGFKYTTSQGSAAASDAKEIIVSALVGLALLLLSWTILRFLGINVG